MPRIDPLNAGTLHSNIYVEDLEESRQNSVGGPIADMEVTLDWTCHLCRPRGCPVKRRHG